MILEWFNPTINIEKYIRKTKCKFTMLECILYNFTRGIVFDLFIVMIFKAPETIIIFYSTAHILI